MESGTSLALPDSQAGWEELRVDRCRRNDRLPSDSGQLLSSWQDLEVKATLPTQCLTFTVALAGSLLAGMPLQVFAATDPESLMALLPLCRDPGLFGRWRIPGAREVFEPGDVLCEGPGAARALANLLAAQTRPVSLDRIPDDSPLIPALAEAMRGKGLVVVRPAMACPTMSLEEWWDDPEAQFSNRRRSDFRRAARKAEALGSVTYEMLTPAPQEFDALFDEAAAVELKSWKREAGSAIVSDPAKEAFHRAWFRSACEEGTLRIGFMRIDGKAVAMQLAMAWGGRFWLFKIGYDEDYSKCSPGTLLMHHAILHATQQRLVSFEFLGNVEPWISELWTQDSRPCSRVRTYPFGPRGLAALTADAMAKLRSSLGPAKAA